MHFEIAKYRVLHERSNNTASFAEHMKFKEKWLLHMRFALIVVNQIKKLKSRYYTFGNAIYRVLHERNNITASFQEHLKFR